jgi:hypothetical protein
MKMHAVLMSVNVIVYTGSRHTQQQNNDSKVWTIEKKFVVYKQAYKEVPQNSATWGLSHLLFSVLLLFGGQYILLVEIQTLLINHLNR